METGMLWYDGDKQKSLAQKVTEAALYFKKKYGRTPDLCLINSKDAERLPADTSNHVDVEGRTVTVCSWKGIVIGHLWIGFEREPEVVPPEPKETSADAFVRHASKVSVS